jgi:hypothetical protein
VIKPDPDPIPIVKRSSEHVVVSTYVAPSLLLTDDPNTTLQTILDDSNEMAVDPEPSGPGKHTVSDPELHYDSGLIDILFSGSAGSCHCAA